MKSKHIALKVKIFGLLLVLAHTFLAAQQPIAGNFTSGGGTRSYIGAVPNNPQGPLRLVILFCGASENAAQMELRGFNNFLGDSSMVVYPEPMDASLGFDNSTGFDDFQMVEDLIASLESNYSLDLNDICIGGFSNGGVFTYNLVCDFNGPNATRPYSFKSFAIVSGAMEAGQADISSCPTAGEVPAILFHGTQDPIIAYGGGNIPAPVSMSSEATESTFGFWATAVNNCTGSPSVSPLPDLAQETPSPSTVELLEYPCSSAPATRLYRINGGRHAWPGGNAQFDVFQSRNMDINASELIAEFFSGSNTLSTNAPMAQPNSVSIYPNPAKDFISIETSNLIRRIEIYNMTGQTVYAENQPIYLIALSDLKPGIYFVKIETDAGMDVKKIIKE